MRFGRYAVTTTNTQSQPIFLCRCKTIPGKIGGSVATSISLEKIQKETSIDRLIDNDKEMDFNPPRKYSGIPGSSAVYQLINYY